MGLIGLLAELVVLAFLCLGIACNAAVIGTCKMLRLGNRGAGYLGPWRIDIYGAGCNSWDKESTDLDDWILNMARACSMMALVFGFILTIYAFFNQCLCPLPCSQIIMDLSGVGVQIGLVLTWPIIRSSVCDSFGGCYWEEGATMLACSQIFYFCASIFTRCMREPRYKRNQTITKKEAQNMVDDAEKKAKKEQEEKDKKQAKELAEQEAQAAADKKPEETEATGDKE